MIKQAEKSYAPLEVERQVQEFWKRAKVYAKPVAAGLDPPGPGPEQDDQGRGRSVAADARVPRAGPARIRHARPPDRGSGREEPRDYEQEGERGARHRAVREHVPQLLPGSPEDDDGAVPSPRGVDGRGKCAHD